MNALPLLQSTAVQKFAVGHETDSSPYSLASMLSGDDQELPL